MLCQWYVNLSEYLCWGQWIFCFQPVVLSWNWISKELWWRWMSCHTFQIRQERWSESRKKVQRTDDRNAVYLSPCANLYIMVWCHLLNIRFGKHLLKPHKEGRKPRFMIEIKLKHSFSRLRDISRCTKWKKNVPAFEVNCLSLLQGIIQGN